VVEVVGKGEGTCDPVNYTRVFAVANIFTW
jgi:hypothetical protein